MVETVARAASDVMDEVDRRLLNRIQSDFPLVGQPFAAIGEGLAIDEREVLDRVAALKKYRIIRQVSAIFDTRTLGYKSMLAAMSVDPEHIDKAAKIINAHPGVSHNYERNHYYNLWFTCAVPPEGDLERHVNRLHELAGARSTRMLPTLKLFKIGVKLDMTGEESITARSEFGYSDAKRPKTPRPLDQVERHVVRELQTDLPLESEPFAPMAERIGISQDELFARAAQLMAEGVMRRYAAILYHRKAGFRSNAMGVWNVPDDRIDSLGPVIASFNTVSHCYQRPRYDDWPYTVFSMIHGRSKAECETILCAISETTGITDYTALFSTREYKKTRVMYFTDDYDEWERKHLTAAAGS